jgi:FtsP/CotA-like multicopper oxidase with cupredoxin domain
MSIPRRELFKSIGFLGLAAQLSPWAFSKASPKNLDLVAKAEQMTWFSDGNETEVWGYSKPVIELNQYVNTVITFTNNLPEPTSVHWHGIAVENSMDGVSGLTQEPVESGGMFEYKITPKDAGTYWAHAHHDTYRQLALGLYTPIIVHEAISYHVEHDLLFVADDWLLNRSEQIDSESFEDAHAWSHGGRMGNMLTINRSRNPELIVSAGSRVRLRVLNAANSRIMSFSFPDLTAHIVAKDGQPLEQPMKMSDMLLLAPAERYDLVIDIPSDWVGSYPIYESSGKKPFLAATWNVSDEKIYERKLGSVLPLPRNPLPLLLEENDHSVTLKMEGGAMGNLKAAYYQGEKLSVNQLTKQRQFWTFNGIANLPEQPLLRVKVGDIVEITLDNTTPWPHAMHLHGHHFFAKSSQLKSEIWQDTILVERRDAESVRFVATSPGKWLLHCHMIEHQVSGMVTYVEVLE